MIELTTNDLNIIRDSYVKLSLDSKNIFENFYDNFFELDPSAKKLFENVNMQKQKRMLFESLSYFINNKEITNLDLEEYADILKNQHQSVHISTSQTKNFELAFIKTIKEDLGNNFTPDIEKSWLKLLEEIFKRFVKEN